jgi:hypothetical protein
MSRIIVGRRYPTPIAYLDRVRNGKIPDWRVPQTIGRAMNFTLAHQRKAVFGKSLCFNSTLSAGASGSTTGWRFRFRSGHASNVSGTLVLHADVLATVILDTLPEFPTHVPQWRIVASSGGSTRESDWRPMYSRNTATGFPALDNVNFLSAEVEIDPDDNVTGYFEVYDYLVLLSASAYEMHVGEVDTTDGQVADTGLFADGADITDAQHKRLCAEGPHALWKGNATHLFTLVPDAIDGTWSTASSTETNMVSASTTVSDATIGYKPNVQFLDPVHTSNVAVVFAAHCSVSAGTGTIKLKDGSGTIATLSPTNTSADWVTTTGNLSGSSSSHKVDVHFACTGGTLTVRSVVCYVYVS